jgi:hypothetical protein
VVSRISDYRIATTSWAVPNQTAKHLEYLRSKENELTAEVQAAIEAGVLFYFVF